jgi:ribosomal protein S18 acetylase RimI-like enzyme
VPHTIRAISRDDQAFVTEMQYEALFVPPGDEPIPHEVLDQPGIARYHAGFGTRPGDVGVIAIGADASRLGAAWVRQLEGYGFVDGDTPELGVAVVAQHRGEGLGRELLVRLFDLVPRCSLSVDDRNPARRLYERLGFEDVRRDGEHAVVMLRDRST